MRQSFVFETFRLIAVLIPGLVLGLAGPALAANQTVSIIGTSFSPRNVTVQAGDTVTWVNDNQGTHNVSADDGSFRSGNPSDQWTFSHTFQVPGTFGYNCEVHQAFGMTGTVTVEASGGGNDEPGKLRFAQASFSTSEGAGKATIAVSRIQGDDGPATVRWSASAGTATSGSDFIGASGTLSWADSDDANKSFQVTILDDSTDEPNETILSALTNATGAALDDARRTAVLTIVDDDDGGTGTVPAAPVNLKAESQSTTEILLTWTDTASNETAFRIERRTLAGVYEEIGTVGANTSSFLAGGVTSGIFYVFRVRAQNNVGNSAYSNEAGAAPNAAPLPCIASATVLCVNSGRFQVEVRWRVPDGTSGPGQALPVASAPDSGLFYFFSSANLEMLIKVLNACGFSAAPRYWVFFAATTNVELGVTVTDTQTGKVKSYFNPLNRPVPPVQDTDAFATCP